MKSLNKGKPPLPQLSNSNRSRDSTLDFLNNIEQPQSKYKAANYAQVLDNSFDFPSIPPYNGIQTNLYKSENTPRMTGSGNHFMKQKNPNESTVSQTSVSLETLN